MRRLIFRKPFIYDTFDWQENVQFKVPGTQIMVQMFTCEQIFAELDSMSEDNEIVDPMTVQLRKTSNSEVVGDAAKAAQ